MNDKYTKGLIIYDEFAQEIYGEIIGHEAEGAITNNTRISKINSHPNDFHLDGAVGIVIGSFDTKSEAGIGYCVEWDDMPGVPVMIGHTRIQETK